MQNSVAPIGIFDSGVGGTSIWKEIVKRLPQESTIYLADSSNAPYGIKPKTEIIDICIKNTELLIAKGCKMIVVACNTATTNTIDILRNKYDIPFIGIEPAIKPAALATQTNAVGILATKGTLSSELFHKTSKKFASHIKVLEQEGTGLVPLIESGKIESLEMETLLTKLLSPMIQENIDYLVLGCSHYPYLIPQIKKIAGNKLNIIDSGFAVAKQTETILRKHDLNNTTSVRANHQLFTNASLKTLSILTHDITNKRISRLDF